MAVCPSVLNGQPVNAQSGLRVTNNVTCPYDGRSIADDDLMILSEMIFSSQDFLEKVLSICVSFKAFAHHHRQYSGEIADAGAELSGLRLRIDDRL